jgi:histidyl-tRNA synthetase
MAQINAPRGTADILPNESPKWHTIERIAREVAELYHFAEIRTPVFEHSELFHRGVGETSDIVHKETYTFNDRGNRSITLRPEGTAGVVRAVIEHGIIAQEGARAKVYYVGPKSDGKTVAMVASGKIYLFDVSSKSVKPFPNSQSAESFPDFSPDGR